MKHAAIAVGTLAAILGVVVLATGESAASALTTCQAQQSAGADAVVVTPTPATTTATATPVPTRREPAAGMSQLTADESGLPQAVDSEGAPIAGAAQLVYPFGTDRDAITRRQAFLIPKDMNADKLTVTLPFQDVTDTEGRPLTAAHLRAVVQPIGPGRLVTVALCINPDHPTEMRAGTYSGTALFGVDERVTPVTLQATVQDDRWLIVFLCALAGLLAGLFIRLFADTQSTDALKRLRHVSWPRILATVGAGLVVAFYSYRTIYLDDPTFYAGTGDLWRVTAEVFAGTIAAKAITDLAGQQQERRGVRNIRD